MVKKYPAEQGITRQRVEELIRIKLDGAERRDAREYIREMEKRPGSCWALKPTEKPMCDRTIFRYLKKVDKLIAESCRAKRDELLSLHLAKRRNLYAKAVLSGDIRAALAVLIDEAKMLSLYPNPKLPPAEDRTLHQMTDAELVEFLQRHRNRRERIEATAK